MLIFVGCAAIKTHINHQLEDHMARIKRLRTPVAAAIVAAAGLTLTGFSSGSDSSNGAAVSAAPAAATVGNTANPVMIGKYDSTNASDATFFATVLRGAKNATGVALVRIQGDEVSFAMSWQGISTPTMSHIHVGAKGVSGAPKVTFFAKQLPGGHNSVIGTVKVTNKTLLQSIRSNPEGFYINIHTKEFPNGALRGQMYPLPGKLNLQSALQTTTLNPVVKGAQVYACTKQASGTYAFTQNNVDATLKGGIKHTFLKPGPAGPPQWVAPDKSAVKGMAVTKVPNGTANIPELVLKATQEGAHSGLLSKTQDVLRLNTVGGVAPTGTCNPTSHPKAQVSYTADYLFVG
jgi:hypothetical protein